jgi:NitT/TauT family transport system substrate-binding protein
MRRRTLIQSSSLLALSALTAATLGSCNQQASDSASNKTAGEKTASGGDGAAPLRVGLIPWIGWGEAHLADVKGFYKEECIEVEQILFQSVTDVNAALLSGQIDLVWLVAGDLVVLSETTPGLKFIYASDYSGEVDAIVGRNLAKPEDIAGKKLAREEVPYEVVFVAKFLESVGLTAEDVNVVALTAADGATALVAENLDAVATYEPFVSTALKSDENKILFTAAGTNIIINGLATGEAVLSDRRADVLAYLRAIEKGNQFRTSSPDEANKIVGEWIGITDKEAADLMTKVTKLDVAENKKVAFSTDQKLNIAGSIDSAGPILVAAGLAKSATPGAELVDGSLVNELD